MKLFEGKTKTERNKIIAAIVLGVVSLFTLYLAFGGSIFGSKTVARASTSPTPKTSPSPGAKPGNFDLPTQEEQNSSIVMPITYNGGTAPAPEAGRNIFAFYEPPPPTPFSPTPPPEVKISPPPPQPTPNVGVSFVNPPGVYAGTKAFKMEVNGDRFTPDVRIYFEGSEMPTTFVSPNQLTTEIPANFFAQEGSKVIEVRSSDGKLWSNQFTFNVQAAPRPQFQYIGLIARKRANNDTAVFQETGKPQPFGARLNDVLGGRFRLVSISSNETIFEDTSLGFRHKLPLLRPSPGGGSTTTTAPTKNTFPGDNFNQGNPFPNPNPNQPPQDIPGIPNNIPRAPQTFQPQPNNNTRRTIDTKKDVDDDDDDDGDN
jgi:hypothetical protein